MTGKSKSKTSMKAKEDTTRKAQMARKLANVVEEEEVEKSGDEAIKVKDEEERSEKIAESNQDQSQQEQYSRENTPMKRTLTAEEATSGSIAKAKRKRRALSCISCRRLKTRCEFEVENGKCHRCHKLRLECSLTKDYNLDPTMIRENQKPDQGTEMKSIHERLNTVESQISDFGNKLDSIISMLGDARQQQKNSTHVAHNHHHHHRSGSMTGSNPEQDHELKKPNNPFTRTLSMNSNSLKEISRKVSYSFGQGSDNYLDKYVEDAPLNIIKAIDLRLFARSNKYDPLKQACEEFMEFYYLNEELCLQLAKSFLEISHFWIIPGGIKELNRKYVIEHPFITCVFVILAMCFDENYNYIEEQQALYTLTSKLLGIALITDPLTDHDIEALLYLSLYNIARKPKQPQMDSWILSGTAIKHFIISRHFTAVKNRITVNHEYNGDDLYHLRIWNSLCACHFQSALLSGRPVLIPKEYLDIHSLTLRFPKAAVGDAIKVSELDLDVNFAKILENSREHLLQMIHIEELKEEEVIVEEQPDEVELLVFEEFEQWKKKWEHLIKRDVSGILSFAYDTYHVIICRRFITTIKEGQVSLGNRSAATFLSRTLKTACHHSFIILNRLLRLPSSLVRGSPSSSLAQIVYASVTLCDFLSMMNAEDKSTALNLISKIYWHLNHIGEKMNDATDTVGKIIKSIVETANKKTRSTPTVVEPNDSGLVFNNDTPAGTATATDVLATSPELHTKLVTTPAESVGSSSSVQQQNNLYSGNLKSLHLKNLIASPDIDKNSGAFATTTTTTATTPAGGNATGHGLETSTDPLLLRQSALDFDSIAIPDVSAFSTFEEFFNGVFSDFNVEISTTTTPDSHSNHQQHTKAPAASAKTPRNSTK